MHAFTYILTNKNNTVLYVGVTSNLEKRLWTHKFVPTGFVQKYQLNKLVWFESGSDTNEAIKREKQLKNWQRLWKTELIEKDNPGWNDLSSDWDIFK